MIKCRTSGARLPTKKYLRTEFFLTWIKNIEKIHLRTAMTWELI